MREKFIRFMNGRNGMDELARAESWVVMILLVVSIFTRSAILDILAIGSFPVYFLLLIKS